MLKENLRTFVLRRLLRRRPPERISSSSPDYGKRNDIYVKGSVGEHTDSLLLELDKNQNISYVWWPTDDEQSHSSDAQTNIESINWDSLSVTQEYYTWRFDYSSPFEAFLHDLLFIPQIRFWTQKIRDRFYTRLTPDKRMLILEEVIKRHSKDQKVKFMDILIKLHGPSIRMSSNHYQYLQSLKFYLRSLESTGDVRVRPEHREAGRDWVEWELHGDVIPEPKAIATLADHADSRRRHADTIRLSRMQFFLGFAMLIVALATLLVRVWGTKP